MPDVRPVSAKVRSLWRHTAESSRCQCRREDQPFHDV